MLLKFLNGWFVSIGIDLLGPVRNVESSILF